MRSLRLDTDAVNRKSVKNSERERLENTENGPQAESQKTTKRLVINLTLRPTNMPGDRWDSSAESLLNDAARTQLQCRERSRQLAVAAAQLRVESAALRQQCEASQLDMAQIRQQLAELMETKYAFESRERQARKLSKQL